MNNKAIRETAKDLGILALGNVEKLIEICDKKDKKSVADLEIYLDEKAQQLERSIADAKDLLTEAFKNLEKDTAEANCALCYDQDVMIISALRDDVETLRIVKSKIQNLKDCKKKLAEMSQDFLQSVNK